MSDVGIKDPAILKKVADELARLKLPDTVRLQPTYTEAGDGTYWVYLAIVDISTGHLYGIVNGNTGQVGLIEGR